MGNSRWLRNSFVYLMIIIGVIVIFLYADAVQQQR